MKNQREAGQQPQVAEDLALLARVIAICDQRHNSPNELIEILHDVQSALGCVPDGVLPTIANALNLSRAEVYGVRTFYHDFRTEPTGRHHLKLCQAEACQAMGADRLAAAVTRSIGASFGGTSANGGVTLEAVYCLGNCALAPAAMLDGKLIGRCTERLIASALAAEPARST